MPCFIKLLKVLVVSLLSLVGVMLFRAEVYFPNSKAIQICNETHEPIAGNEFIDRFSKALQFKTITTGTHDYDRVELKKFANFLQNSFPVIYSSPFVTVETVNNYSLLYSVKGSDLSLKPYLLCSHLDVVPVELDNWDIDPFGGIVKDGYIYGRGAIDVKNTLMSILESFEYLLKNGFKPRRSFYIAFGHDEEAQGFDGAQEVAKLFAKRGIKEFEFLLDEGTVIFNDMFPGVDKLVAIVAVSEKGYLTLNIKAKGPVGHSSLAPIQTSIIRLANAVSKLTSDAHRNLFGLGPEKDMFESFASHAKYPFKLIYSNLWFFSPILSRVISKQPTGNSLVRTTSAVTMINGGFKENVLPSEANAVVNHRVHPFQTIEQIIQYDKELINDENVEISIKGDPVSPHPISPYHSQSFGYQTIKTSLGQVFDDTIVIPGIMIATTDTRWYLNFTNSVYRFSPSVMMEQKDTQRFHGHNERISIKNYLKTVNFYHHIILNSDESKLKNNDFIKDEL